MSDIQIHYIATKIKVVDALKQHYSKQGIQFIKCDIDGIDEIKHLLIIEPVEIKNDLFALSSIWKTWLMTHRPHVRLFFAGFASSQHKNYLNLLNLPNDLRTWIEKTYPVNAYPLEKKGETMRNGFKYDVYDDPWERFMPLTGRNMRKQLKKFTDGHDSSNSFFVQTARLRKYLVDIRFLNESLATSIIPTEEIKKDLAYARAEAQREWSVLNGRWAYYQKFFDNMPFAVKAKSFDTIPASIKTQPLAAVIAGIMKKSSINIPQFGSGTVVPDLERVDELIKLVEVELNRYVNFEQHW